MMFGILIEVAKIVPGMLGLVFCNNTLSESVFVLNQTRESRWNCMWWRQGHAPKLIEFHVAALHSWSQVFYLEE